MQIPIIATHIAEYETRTGIPVIAESVDALEQKERENQVTPNWWLYFLGFPLSSIVLGFIILGIIQQLMPIIHTEILREEDVNYIAYDDEDDENENNVY